MKKQNPKPAKTVFANAKRWAEPDLARDRKELACFYRDYLATDDDFEGLGPADIQKLAELAKTLQRLKERQ